LALDSVRQRILSIVDGYTIPPRVGIAVSGGSDSMCLTHLCHILSQESGKFLVVAINIDHTTRRGSSTKESAFVADYCAKESINISRHIVDAPKYARDSGMGFEAAARELRYGIFECLIKNGEVDIVFTAHHALDNAETFLLNALRGSGMRGLGGIRDCPKRGLYRPLIKTSKSHITKYLSENNVPYITDSSNDDIRYTRNFVRHKVIPLIEERFVGASNRLANLAIDLACDEDFVMSHIDKSLYGERGLSLSALCNHQALRVRYVIGWLECIGVEVTRESIDNVIRLSTLDNGDRISLTGNISIERAYDKIVVIGNGAAAVTAKLKEVDKDRLPLPLGQLKNNRGRYFDMDKLPGDAVVRNRKDGDTVSKLDGSTVRLKKYMCDKKIPRHIRDTISLVCTGNAVLMVAGYEVSGSIAVTDKTVRVGELVQGA